MPITYNSFFAKDINEAFEAWYYLLASQDISQPSRVGNVVGEVLNAVTVIQRPDLNILTSPIRNLPMRYAVGELLWYLSGSDKLADIERYSKFWRKISDDGERLNSAYGYRIFKQFGFDQWEHCKNLLTKDPYSRQAILHIKDASNIPTKDVPCTVSLQFQIRENKLYLTTYMRSNDLWLGFPYDVFAFTCFQIKMAMELNCGLGTYTHIAGSLHLYEKDVLKNGIEKDKAESN